MKTARLALCAGAISLSGCGLMLKLFPHRPSGAEAKRAIQYCGASRDDIAWHVTGDGILVFGPKTETAPLVPQSVTECLLSWGRWNRVKIGLILWDPRPRT